MEQDSRVLAFGTTYMHTYVDLHTDTHTQMCACAHIHTNTYSHEGKYFVFLNIATTISAFVDDM